MAFNMFPWTNLHNLNADWLLKTVKECKEAVEESLAAVRAALTDAVLYTSQSKDTSSRRVACTNIHAVSYDSTVLQTAEKAQARTNIGAASDTDMEAAVDRISGAEDRIGGVEDRMTAAETDIDNLESSRVSYAAQQQLTDTQKTTARGNIGAAPSLGVVMYNTAQSLSDAYKAQARENIGAISSADIPTITGTVQYDQAQSLTDAQKAQARSNISAAAASDIPNVSDVLRYSAQSLTASQKAQARQNIGVSNEQDQPFIVTVETNELGTGYQIDHTLADIIQQINYGRIAVVAFTPIGSHIQYFSEINLDQYSTNNAANATIFLPQTPGSAAATIWYYIALINDGTSDSLTVSEYSVRLAPDCTISDNGKVLSVSNGRPAWVQKDPTVVTDLVSSSITLAAADNTIYKYGTLSSLTVSSFPATGAFSITFTSGSTATTLTVPQTLVMHDSFTVEANTRYEINVLDGYAVAAGWSVSA